MPIRLTVSLRPPKHLGGGPKIFAIIACFSKCERTFTKKTASVYYFLNKYYVHILG